MDACIWVRAAPTLCRDPGCPGLSVVVSSDGCHALKRRTANTQCRIARNREETQLNFAFYKGF